jgi:hypothetical protein
VLNAWTELRPAKSFANMTLAQFTAKIQPSLDARSALNTLADAKLKSPHPAPLPAQSRGEGKPVRNALANLQ